MGKWEPWLGNMSVPELTCGRLERYEEFFKIVQGTLNFSEWFCNIICRFSSPKSQKNRNFHTWLTDKETETQFKGHSTHKAGKPDWNSCLALNIELFPLHHAASQKSVKACKGKVFLAPQHRRELWPHFPMETFSPMLVMIYGSNSKVLCFSNSLAFQSIWLHFT